MTTEINPYHTSKIYKISSNQCEKFYIGSTTQTLKTRLSLHKAHYKRYIEKGIGCCFTSFEVVKFEDVIIELVRDVNCENRKELEIIEGGYIKEYHDRILNKIVVGRTPKEYWKTHKNESKVKNTKYRETHKEQIIEKKKEYYEAHKNEIKEQSKEYYEANKNEIKERREANKEKLYEKFNCDCGGKYTLQNKTTHEKTQRHIDFNSS